MSSIPSSELEHWARDQTLHLQTLMGLEDTCGSLVPPR